MNYSGIKKIGLLALFIGFFSMWMSGQNIYQTGEWTGHVSYRSVEHVEVGGKFIYASAARGFFKYNTQNGEFTTISKVNGLSDIQISAIKYHKKRKFLAVGHISGLIDLVYDNETKTINDIQEASSLNSRRINNIHFLGDTAFFACDFGIVVIDLKKMEVSGTYFLGTSQQAVVVHDVATTNDSIWVATNKGMFKASLIDDNLHNYQSWQQIIDIPNDSASYKFVEKVGSKLFFVADPENSADRIHMYENGYKGTYLDGYNITVKQLDLRGDYVTMNAGYGIRFFDQSGDLAERFTFLGTDSTWISATDAVKIDTTVYIADNPYGLVQKHGDNYRLLLPNGPYANSINHIASSNGATYVSGGTPGARWKRYGFYRYQNNQWTNYNERTLPEMDVVGNINYTTIDKGDPSHVFACSFGYGVMEFRDTVMVNHWNQSNSPLENFQNIPSGYILCSGLAFDDEGDVWVNTSLVSNTLYHYRMGGDWQAFNFDGTISNVTTSSLINTSWGHMWFAEHDFGLVAFDPEKVKNGEIANAYKRFRIIGNDNNVLTTNVTALAVDKSNYIWLGLSNGGLAVYYNPQQILDYNLTAARIIVESDGIAQYLLDNEIVSTITVDAANRKWVGTEAGGAFLISENGTEQILNLNVDNSSLLSNSIRDISIDHTTGWVYFGTDGGLVAYYSGTVESEEIAEKLKVFPNPVRENYNGLVRIEGLTNGVNVKITDVAGNIVFETTARGATALWNMMDFNNQRVQTGVYLIYATTKDGSQRAISKIFVARNE
jgi:hypothetical protein